MRRPNPSRIVAAHFDVALPQLKLLPRVKAVIRMGAGYDNIDTKACADANVIACNCPDAWVEEVADSTLSLLLAIIRRTFDLSELVSKYDPAPAPVSRSPFDRR